MIAPKLAILILLAVLLSAILGGIILTMIEIRVSPFIDPEDVFLTFFRGLSIGALAGVCIVLLFFAIFT